MKTNNEEQTYLLSDTRPGVTYIPFVASIVIHLAFFSALVFMPSITKSREFIPPPAIHVSMVNMPEPEAAPKPETKTEADIVWEKEQEKYQQEKQAKIQEEPEPEPEPVVEEKAPEPEPEPEQAFIEEKEKKEEEPKEPEEKKKKPPKKEVETKKVIPKKVKKVKITKKKIPVKKKTKKPEISKKPDESRKKEIDRAISRIRERLRQGQSQSGWTASANEFSNSGTSDPGILNAYIAEIAHRVERNWAYSDQMAGEGRNMKASLVFKVLPDGRISDLQFQDQSDSEYLNESAYRAIMKSSPLPAHPKGIHEKFVGVGLNFTPRGLL